MIVRLLVPADFHPTVQCGVLRQSDESPESRTHTRLCVHLERRVTVMSVVSRRGPGSVPNQSGICGERSGAGTGFSTSFPLSEPLLSMRQVRFTFVCHRAI